jgi:hypothetical protein
MVDIEGILEEVVVKVMGHASRKNAFWLILIDRDCSGFRLYIKEGGIASTSTYMSAASI